MQKLLNKIASTNQLSGGLQFIDSFPVLPFLLPLTYYSQSIPNNIMPHHVMSHVISFHIILYHIIFYQSFLLYKTLPWLSIALRIKPRLHGTLQRGLHGSVPEVCYCLILPPIYPHSPIQPHLQFPDYYCSFTSKLKDSSSGKYSLTRPNNPIIGLHSP